MTIDKCVQDAISHLSPQAFDIDGTIQTNTLLLQKEFDIYVWTQTWDDSSCGHILECSMSAVYHDGQMVYKIKKTNEYFLHCVQQHRIPAINSEATTQFEEGSKYANATV